MDVDEAKKLPGQEKRLKESGQPGKQAHELPGIIVFTMYCELHKAKESLNGDASKDEVLVVLKEMEENVDLVHLLADPNTTQQSLFVALENFAVRHADKGLLVVAVFAHIIGDMLNSLTHYTKAIASFCIALSRYEDNFRRVQAIMRSAIAKVR